jgi:hypothetical protein
MHRRCLARCAVCLRGAAARIRAARIVRGFIRAPMLRCPGAPARRIGPAARRPSSSPAASAGAAGPAPGRTPGVRPSCASTWAIPARATDSLFLAARDTAIVQLVLVAESASGRRSTVARSVLLSAGELVVLALRADIRDGEASVELGEVQHGVSVAGKFMAPPVCTAARSGVPAEKNPNCVGVRVVTTPPFGLPQFFRLGCPSPLPFVPPGGGTPVVPSLHLRTGRDGRARADAGAVRPSAAAASRVGAVKGSAREKQGHLTRTEFSEQPHSAKFRTEGDYLRRPRPET